MLPTDWDMRLNPHSLGSQVLSPWLTQCLIISAPSAVDVTELGIPKWQTLPLPAPASALSIPFSLSDWSLCL